MGNETFVRIVCSNPIQFQLFFLQAGVRENCLKNKETKSDFRFSFLVMNLWLLKSASFHFCTITHFLSGKISVKIFFHEFVIKKWLNSAVKKNVVQYARRKSGLWYLYFLKVNPRITPCNHGVHGLARLQKEIWLIHYYFLKFKEKTDRPIKKTIISSHVFVEFLLPFAL